MKQKVLILFAAIAALTACVGGSSNEKGIVISGVKWATRNIGDDGKFASSPEDIGYFGGFYSIPDSLFPKGWRLPTVEELTILVSEPHQSVTRGGVQGELYGVEPNVIFLPYHSGYNRKDGIYWSGTKSDGTTIRTLHLSNPDYVYSDDYYRDGCVRLVHDDGTNSVKEQKSAVSTDINGVIINGIRWVTRNVDAAKTFAGTPESVGMFYQWNSNVDWNRTGDCDDKKPWKTENDPSPEGWRIPAIDDIHALCDESKVTRKWSELNGVSGMLFIDKQNGNSIFLPIGGRLHHDNGGLIGKTFWGMPWINHYDEKINVANHLYFSDTSLKLDYQSGRNGSLIRSVKK